MPEISELKFFMDLKKNSQILLQITGYLGKLQNQILD